MFFELYQAAQNQPITPSSVPEALHFGTQFGSGAVAVFIIQMMKKLVGAPVDFALDPASKSRSGDCQFATHCGWRTRRV